MGSIERLFEFEHTTGLGERDNKHPITEDLFTYGLFKNADCQTEQRVCLRWLMEGSGGGMI